MMVKLTFCSDGCDLGTYGIYYYIVQNVYGTQVNLLLHMHERFIGLLFQIWKQWHPLISAKQCVLHDEFVRLLGGSTDETSDQRNSSTPPYQPQLKCTFLLH